MSHTTARHDPRAAAEDEDATTPQARPPAPRQRVPRQPVGQPAGDGIGPDDPDEGEFEIAGDNDLGPADLGPADPNATNPDADSGRMRKIAKKTGRDPSTPQQ